MTDLDLDLAALRRTAEAATQPTSLVLPTAKSACIWLEPKDVEFYNTFRPPTVIALLDALAATKENERTLIAAAREYISRLDAQQKVVDIVVRDSLGTCWKPYTVSGSDGGPIDRECGDCPGCELTDALDALEKETP